MAASHLRSWERSAPEPALRRFPATVLFLLIAQFMLGMAVNLFVKIPTSHPGRNASEYFGGVASAVVWAIAQGPFWLRLHTLLGLLLAIASISFLVQAVRSGLRRWILVAVLGFIGILAAGFNGGSFLNYSEDFSSMLMSTGFALATTAYIIALL